MKAAVRWLLVIVVSVVILTGCWSRLYPPVAHVELLAPIYPEARPQNCNLTVLSAPPSQPFATFAQVVSYAGSTEMANGMESLIKKTACEIGADAIVLMPMREGTHFNTDDTYPDWVLERGFGQGGRFPHWVDKRYNVSQRAFAVVFKREPANEQQKPEKPGS